MSCRYSGFTLFELLITLTLIAILVGLGLPSFAAINANSRLRTEVDALFHAIHLARKESIMRRSVVSICPSFDGLTCRPGKDWSGGWIIPHPETCMVNNAKVAKRTNNFIMFNPTVDGQK